MKLLAQGPHWVGPGHDVYGDQVYFKKLDGEWNYCFDLLDHRYFFY